MSFLLLGLPTTLRAQIPTIWSVPSPVPCDSVWIDSIPITNMSGGAIDIVSIDFRDSVSFFLGASFALPHRVVVDGNDWLPIEFRPGRRGGHVDSILILVTFERGGDTLIEVRVDGQAIGAAVAASPIVLNFPRTNPGASVALSMRLTNLGELPATLTPADIVPPAPFRLVTPLPTTVLPGGTLDLSFAFEPTVKGFFSWLGIIPSGCGNIVQVGLYGVTDIDGTGAVIRTTKLGFEPANDERYPCDVAACTDVTISNVGNAPLIIENLAWAIDTAGYVITPGRTLPFTIAPGSSEDITICLSSRAQGVLRDTLVITSNDRQSTAFGLLLDISGSMSTPMNCQGYPPGLPLRLQEAVRQAQLFIATTLLYLPGVGVQDQLAVATYTNTGRTVIDLRYPLTWMDDNERQRAQDALLNLTAGGNTPTGQALDSMIRVIARSPLNRRVIVLLSDGQPRPGSDSVNFPVNTLVTRANQAGIKIFTIGIGATNPAFAYYLGRYANGTGGQYFGANTCGDLQAAFETITDLISRGSVDRNPFAVTVLAPHLVIAPVRPFDSTHIGRTICQQTTITNIGQGDAIVDSVTVVDLLGGPNSEFTLAPGVTLPMRIAEGAQVSVQVCFSPQRIRMRQGTGLADYNSCGLGPLSLGLLGPGYAYANLRVDDKRVALPGSIVTLPIYADSSLVDYTVTTIAYHVRWKKSMLDLRAVRPLGSATSATLSGAIAFDGRHAIAPITVGGLPGVTGGEPIAELEFQVLRGDTLASLVELLDATFEDGNPRPLLQNAGLVAFDSTCFRDFKPLGFATVGKLVVGEPSPVPTAQGRVSIPLSCEGQTAVRVDLHAVDGTSVVPTTQHDVHDGPAELVVELHDLPNGRYYLVLRAADGTTFVRNLVVAK